MLGDDPSEGAVLIDCDSCAVRDLQCGDCVVTVLLGGPPGAVEVDDQERRALDVLAESGLVPRLRLVPAVPPEVVVARQAAEAERGVS